MNEEYKQEVLQLYYGRCHIHTFVKRFQCGCGDRILKEFKEYNQSINNSWFYT